MASNFFGRVFWVFVSPGGVFICFSFDFNAVVIGLSFPGAGAGGLGFFEKLHVERIGREILIAFDFYGFVALCEDLSFPCGGGHF